jgi:hypothetical protein
LKLNLRNKQALILGYFVPILCLFAFAAFYKTKPTLRAEISMILTISTLGGACFGLPTALVPSEPEAPDAAYERCEMQDKVRAAIGSLPPREQKVITLYYSGDVTMKQIGAEIGVNESRVSQLHARAIKRLRVVLGDMAPGEAMSALKNAVLAFHQKPVMAKAALQLPAAAATIPAAVAAKAPAVVVNIMPVRPKFVAAHVAPRTSSVAVAAAR